MINILTSSFIVFHRKNEFHLFIAKEEEVEINLIKNNVD